MVNPPSTELIFVFVSGFSLVLIYSSLPAADAEKQQTVGRLKCTRILKKASLRLFDALYNFTACGIAMVWAEEYYHKQHRQPHLDPDKIYTYSNCALPTDLASLVEPCFILMEEAIPMT